MGYPKFRFRVPGTKPESGHSRRFFLLQFLKVLQKLRHPPLSKMAKNEETVFHQPIFLRRPYTTRRSGTLSDIKGGLSNGLYFACSTSKICSYNDA